RTPGPYTASLHDALPSFAVQHPRAVGERLDVLPGVDRRVPGDAVEVGGQHLVGPVLEGRVLDPGVREAGQHARVERRVGLHLDGDRKSTRLNSSHVKISY